MEKSVVKTIARLLVFVGAINWGLEGLAYFTRSNFNLVNMAVGSWPALEAVVYILVALSAIYLAIPGKR